MISKITSFFKRIVSKTFGFRSNNKQKAPKPLSAKEKTNLHGKSQVELFRSLGTTKVLDEISRLGQLEVNKTNKPHGNNFIAAFGEGHGSGVSEHRCSRFLTKHFKEFKSRGFETFAVEIPSDSLELIKKTGKPFDLKSPIIKEIIEEMKELFIKHNSFEQDVFVKILSQGEAKAISLQQSGSSEEIAQERIPKLIKAAEAAGLEVKAIDAPQKDTIRNSMIMTTALGIKDYMKTLDSKKDASKIAILKQIHAELKERMNGIFKRRDEYMADQLAKALGKGSVLTVLGAMHVGKQSLQKEPAKTAAQILKAKKLPVVSIMAEQSGMFTHANKVNAEQSELDERAKLHSTISDLVDAENMPADMLFETRRDEKISKALFYEGDKKQLNYGDLFDASLVLVP